MVFQPRDGQNADPRSGSAFSCGIDTLTGIVWRVFTAWGSLRSVRLAVVPDALVALHGWGAELPLSLGKMSESKEVEDLSLSEFRTRRAVVR